MTDRHIIHILHNNYNIYVTDRHAYDDYDYQASTSLMTDCQIQ